MSAPVCRLLPFVTTVGAWQMAADEAMLEAAAEGTASLRVYGWSEATISLGYFQPAAVRLSEPLFADLPYVRRSTGGEALVHHHEVTYALALPPGPTWKVHSEPWRRLFHTVLSDVFRSFGIITRLCEQERRLGTVLCFLHHTTGDLLLGEAKIVGSAQRKLRGAVLQHGGILLAQSPFTPALPGIAELTGILVSPKEFVAVLGREFLRATGWQLHERDWSKAEQQRIEAIAATKYADREWNDKR